MGDRVQRIESVENVAELHEAINYLIGLVRPDMINRIIKSVKEKDSKTVFDLLLEGFTRIYFQSLQAVLSEEEETELIKDNILGDTREKLYKELEGMCVERAKQHEYRIDFQNSFRMMSETMSLHTVYQEYCNIMSMIFMESMVLAYPGGKTYEQFVEELLVGYSISNDLKHHLADNFKKHISNVRKNFPALSIGISKYRERHAGQRDRNKNAMKAYYRPVRCIDEAEMKFEFFIRKINKSKGIDEKAMEVFEKERIKCVEPYIEKGVDIEGEIKQYRELQKKSFRDMELDDLKQYDKWLKIKEAYIRNHADSKLLNPSLWNLYAPASKLKLLFTVNERSIYSDYIVVMSQAFAMVMNAICGELDEEERIFLWNVGLQLLEVWGSDKGLAIYRKDCSNVLWFENEDEGVVDYIEGYMSDDVWETWLQYIKTMPSFSEEECLRSLRDHLIKGLNNSNEGMGDFIEICLNALQVHHSSKDIDRIVNVFRNVFAFIDKCSRKEYEARKGGEVYRIEDEFDKLENMFDECGIKYDNRRIETVYDKAGSYFKQRYNTRYANLILYLKKQIDTEKYVEREMDINKFVQAYMDSILVKRNQSWGIVPSALKEDFSGDLLTLIVDCLYPNHQPEWDEDKLYKYKRQLLNTLRKYVSLTSLGME